MNDVTVGMENLPNVFISKIDLYPIRSPSTNLIVRYRAQIKLCIYDHSPVRSWYARGDLADLKVKVVFRGLEAADALNDGLDSLYDYNLNNNFEGIIYPREWGSNSSNANMLRGFGCEAFEEGYWDEFIVHIEKNGIKPESVPTIFEQTLLFNYDENYDQVISYLESVEDLFVGYSNSKENKYTAVGNGEGLALAYACIKSNVEFDKFQYIKTI